MNHPIAASPRRDNTPQVTMATHNAAVDGSLPLGEVWIQTENQHKHSRAFIMVSLP